MRMVEEQENMRVPEELVPYCPACGEPMSMNLRCDDAVTTRSLRMAAGMRLP